MTVIIKNKNKRKGIFNNPARQWIFTKPGLWFSFKTSFLIFIEFFRGFLFIANYGKAVSFFGSAREKLPQKYYEDCEEIAARLSKKDFAIITGGAGGIMRAGNKGAWKVGGESVGINIVLPNEQINNNFLTSGKDFRYFFSRKTILSCTSEIYIFFPGGFGTLDELFEMLTAMQTNHSEGQAKVFLYGKEWWTPLIEFIKNTLYKNEVIGKDDMDLFKLVDSVDELEYEIDLLGELPPRVCNIGPQEGYGN